MRLLTTSTLLIIFIATSLQAHADFLYEFGMASTSPVDEFTIFRGKTIEIEVYLSESGEDILEMEDLFSGGVELILSNTSVATVKNIRANPDFDEINREITAAGGSLTAAALLNPFLQPDAMNRILLGTFTLTGLSVGDVMLTAIDPNPSLAETVTGSGTILDTQIAPAEAKLTVVPEPESLALTSFGSVFTVLAIMATRMYFRSRQRWWIVWGL